VIDKAAYNVNLFRLSRDMVQDCKPKLDNIKRNLGDRNDIYLKFSNELASFAMACLIAYVNYNGDVRYGIAPHVSSHEINAMAAIGALEMNAELRKRYNEQKQALQRLYQPPQGTGKPGGIGGGGGGGCYIATMAYGDYDHPQVLILRNFRDNILNKSASGRLFIKIYYKYSPRLVEILKNHRTINTIIRKTLDQFIKLIRK
jgi:hypothetical protein